MIYRTLAFALFILVFCFDLSFALDKTSTGFYYPIGEDDFDSGSGGWLYGASGYPSYLISGLYHIGIDMMRDGDVYAISDGKIFYKHCDDDSWGPGNCALLIRHKTSDGTIFTGLYGHIRTSLNDGDDVKIGRPIGYTGPYSTGKHLHFGIRMGDSTSPSPWGRLPNSSWSSTNNFINPISFIQNNSPYVNFSDDSSLKEANVRVVGNKAWYPGNVDCQDAEVWFEITYDRCIQRDSSICSEVPQICQ